MNALLGIAICGGVFGVYVIACRLLGQAAVDGTLGFILGMGGLLTTVGGLIAWLVN